MSNLVTLGSYGLLPTAYRAFDDFDTLLENLFSDRRGHDRSLTHSPRVNIEETTSGYSIYVAAPGLSREDFKIHSDAGYLTVSADLKDKSENSSKWISREYSYSTFTRSWKLPVNTQAEGINARYEAGVLTVNIPVAAKKSSKVEVKVE